MRLDPVRTLLLVDCDPHQQRLAIGVAGRCGWRAVLASRNGALPEGAGAMLIGAWQEGTDEYVRRVREECARLAILACGDGAQLAQAIRGGASDFLALPLTPERLQSALFAAADRRRVDTELRPLTQKDFPLLSFDQIVGSAPSFRAALAVAAKAARTRCPIFIEGERGSGRSTVAAAVHLASGRGSKPFHEMDCSAVSAGLLSSELFGHEKGAFPGAFEARVGRLAQADGSTLFIEEVGALSPELQERLLAFLETGEVRRIGSRGFKLLDVRVIAGSTRPLAEEVREGRYRPDLYERLSGVSIRIPPLRERRSDIPSLARHFLARLSETHRVPRLSIADDALATLVSFGWPGNVTQLHNALLRASLRSSSASLTATDLPRVALEARFSNRADDYHSAAPSRPDMDPAPGIALYQPDGHLRTIEEIEADLIRLAIGIYGGRMTEVARRLGMGRSTLYRKLAELGISEAA
ncbi:MAG TPA: sigma-54 dependent transcriptional regulator [Allosphingosinicella sp.]|nr:sigma-54 dependent transcriptional regulator [Allosphingosinicella sp.]